MALHWCRYCRNNNDNDADAKVLRSLTCPRLAFTVTMPVYAHHGRWWKIFGGKTLCMCVRVCSCHLFVQTFNQSRFLLFYLSSCSISSQQHNISLSLWLNFVHSIVECFKIQYFIRIGNSTLPSSRCGSHI